MLRPLAFVSLLAASWANAQPVDELANLKAEQARLRQSLEEIDRRIRALEGVSPGSDSVAAPVATGATPSSLPPLVALQRNWSEIRPGTPKARVHELLGKPEREIRINSDRVWYYVYPGIGRGSVFFNTQERVSSTQAPRSSWSW